MMNGLALEGKFFIKMMTVPAHHILDRLMTGKKEAQ
jgi:hypothetical protein